MANPTAQNCDDLLFSIANAMWQTSQGYTTADATGAVQWHQGNADDRRERDLFMSHAASVLEHLRAAGWRPPDGS